MRAFTARIHGLGALVCLALALALAVVPPPARTLAGPCEANSIGVDTSLANGLDGPILGEAYGQVFLATDTLISEITVWRIASEDTNAAGWHLFITATDSTGAPAPNSILLDGPTIVEPFGDGIHAIPMRFTFSPAYALPRAGKYYFAIQADPCDSFFNMLFNGSNAYLDGEVWRNGRTIFGGCHLRNFPQRFPSVDLVFTIEFCDPTTPTRPYTWGRLKSQYH